MSYDETDMETTGQVLVIGYGNTLRRDDGAGVALAQRMVMIGRAEGWPMSLLLITQLAPEVAAEIAQNGVEAVVFVDTGCAKLTLCDGEYVTEHPTIEVTRVDIDAASPSLGHHLDPAALLTYVELLYDRQVPAWLVTLPGSDFDHGEGFSPEVYRLLDEAPSLTEQIYREIQLEIEHPVDA